MAFFPGQQAQNRSRPSIRTSLPAGPGVCFAVSPFFSVFSELAGRSRFSNRNYATNRVGGASMMAASQGRDELLRSLPEMQKIARNRS
jgi:hypothetical protein